MSKQMYRSINVDQFPAQMEISFVDGDGRQTMVYQKMTWSIDGEERGLRYGENPDQKAALYRLVNGNLTLGEASTIEPGRFLSSDVELLQSGKHPGKINITDADSALNILRFFTDDPTTVIIKHNNPCGVSSAVTLEQSYERAYMADRVAAFGGAVAVNRELDLATAERIAESYCEVVVAPGYAEGAVDRLKSRKNLRIMVIRNIEKLRDFVGTRVVEFKSLIDGGVVAQWSQVPELTDAEGFRPAQTEHKGSTHTIERAPTESEQRDMRFGWLVEFGVTSNSVIYVKDQTTVGIGTGEQDRVGVAEIARDKAYRNLADRIAWAQHATSYRELTDPEIRKQIWAETEAAHGDISGGVMVSDAFFPFPDGVQVGIRESISAVVQPGGALRDHEIIAACNDAGVTMAFTGQRSFRH